MERRDNRQAEPTFAAQQQAIDQHKEALHYIQAAARTLAPYDVFAPRAIGVGVVVTARGWRLAPGCREGRQVEAGLSRECRFGRLLQAARLRAVGAQPCALTVNGVSDIPIPPEGVFLYAYFPIRLFPSLPTPPKFGMTHAFVDLESEGTDATVGDPRRRSVPSTWQSWQPITLPSFSIVPSASSLTQNQSLWSGS